MKCPLPRLTDRSVAPNMKLYMLPLTPFFLSPSLLPILPSSPLLPLHPLPFSPSSPFSPPFSIISVLYFLTEFIKRETRVTKFTCQSVRNENSLCSQLRGHSKVLTYTADPTLPNYPLLHASFLASSSSSSSPLLLH